MASRKTASEGLPKRKADVLIVLTGLVAAATSYAYCDECQDQSFLEWLISTAASFSEFASRNDHLIGR